MTTYEGKQAVEGQQPRKHRFTKTLAAAALICAAIVFDSKYRIVTEEYEVFSEKLPSEFDGFRIVQVSDLHCMEFGTDNWRLLRSVAEAEADIIALTGDFIENADDLPALDKLLAELTKLAPVYFVSGNHDWASGAIDALADLLSKRGVTYLRNGYEILKKDGENIVLCGVEDPNGYADMPKPDEFIGQLREKYPDDYVLMLAHRNYWPERYLSLDVDTILCGHGHGGIIRLPFLGGLVGPHMEAFPEYSGGLYEFSTYDLVVSRGLGNSVSVPRFLNNAHLPVIILRVST